MGLDPKILRERLGELKSLDSELKIFGANGHRYRLNPPLTASKVAAVEKKYAMRLPEDYRRFILEVANGGAGPYYGVFKLGQQDDVYGYRSWEGGFLLGDPSKPFAHRKAWNLSEELWAQEPDVEGMSEDEEEKALEKWDARLEKEYWNPKIMDGAIPICHIGCALRQWLIVTGPEAGRVWQDDRADNAGLRPLDRTFAEWYMGWLDTSLRSIPRRHRS